MSKETDIDCLLKSIDYNLTDWARAEFHKWLRKKDKTISDLEAKLATKENTITNLIEDNRASQEWCKKQLAEKEKEIEINKNALKKLIKNCDTVKCEHKISFAVEQLEQLKHDIWTDQQDNGWLDEQVDIYFLTETIDNQIKRLTHQHEDKGEWYGKV